MAPPYLPSRVWVSPGCHRPQNAPFPVPGSQHRPAEETALQQAGRGHSWAAWGLSHPRPPRPRTHAATRRATPPPRAQQDTQGTHAKRPRVWVRAQERHARVDPRNTAAAPHTGTREHTQRHTQGVTEIHTVATCVGTHTHTQQHTLRQRWHRHSCAHVDIHVGTRSGTRSPDHAETQHAPSGTTRTYMHTHAHVGGCRHVPPTKCPRAAQPRAEHPPAVTNPRGDTPPSPPSPGCTEDGGISGGHRSPRGAGCGGVRPSVACSPGLRHPRADASLPVGPAAIYSPAHAPSARSAWRLAAGTGGGGRGHGTPSSVPPVPPGPRGQVAPCQP